MSRISTSCKRNAQSALPAVRVVGSVELLGERRELRILHQGEQYTLRVTRLGKLILTSWFP